MEPVTLVDAENVRRSQWPNIEPAELVRLVRGWAEVTGSHALVVFDGPPPDVVSDRIVKVVGTKRESADDRIVRDAERLARAGRPYRLVTSDRGLRERVRALGASIEGAGALLERLD